MLASKYQELMSDRPEKATEREVSYQMAEDDDYRCDHCLHYYERKLDGFGVCEIMRPEKDESVRPDWVCEWFTPDGEEFPLYKRAR